MLTIYAGCAADKVAQVVDLSLAELRVLRETPVPADELRRAKDHLKGSLVLNLESSASRMSHLARQFIFFGRHFTLDEMTASVEAVTADDVQRVAKELFQDRGMAATVVGPSATSPLSGELRV
jgi:predicted Zn-dependent peptidase